jgi:hypothetical protein
MKANLQSVSKRTLLKEMITHSATKLENCFTGYYFFLSFNSQFPLQNVNFEISQVSKSHLKNIKRKLKYIVKHITIFVRIDASEDDGSLGRLINHSRLPPNFIFDPKNPPKQNAFATSVKKVGIYPRLLIVANRDIAPGEEVLFDYGERRIEIIEKHSWLKSDSNAKRFGGKC